MHSLVFLKRGQINHYLQATFYEHSKHESTSGAQHFIQNLDMKEPARFLKKPLSLLITDVLCRQRGNLWDFMHSQFRWSSSPLSLSVALKWQHHYCLFEHSGDMALFPLAWWNRSYEKEPAAAAAMIALSLGLGTVMCDDFPLCIHVLWSEKTPPTEAQTSWGNQTYYTAVFD